MEIARLDTQNKNNLWGAPFCAQNSKDCDKMLLVNNPDPTFQFFDGCLNPLDRDYWNAHLDQRTFLIERPPVQHINRPQSTNFCNYRGDCPPPSLTDPKLNQASNVYYEEFLTPRPKNLGLPTTNNQFCSASQMCNQAPTFPKANYNTGTCVPANFGTGVGANSNSGALCFGSDQLAQGAQGVQGTLGPVPRTSHSELRSSGPVPRTSHSELRSSGNNSVVGTQSNQVGQFGRSPGGGVNGRRFMKAMYDHCESVNKGLNNTQLPGVNGVKYNVETESALRRLDHYCPTDVFDSRVDIKKISQNTLDQALVYYPECTNFYQNPNFYPLTLPKDPNCQPLKGLETPMVWRNLTKMRNRYLVEDISDSANLSECNR